MKRILVGFAAVVLASALFFGAGSEKASAQGVSIGCGPNAGCRVVNIAPYGLSTLNVWGVYANGGYILNQTWQWCGTTYGCYLSTVIPHHIGVQWVYAHSPGQVVYVECFPPVGGGGGGSW